MTERTVRLEQRDTVAVLTLARPDQRNAISEALLDELDHALGRLPAETRVIVLAGDGPHFCAGLDLKEHHGKARSGVDPMNCAGRSWPWWRPAAQHATEYEGSSS